MSLLAQDPNQRYKVRPRRALPDPEQDIATAQPPTAKVPEKVAVPVPVPVPAPSTQRYKITPPPVDMMTGQPARTIQPGLGTDQMNRSVTQPFYPTTPTGDTATAPDVAGQIPAQPAQPQPDIPPGLQGLHDAQARLAADEAAPVKKDKLWKSALKMLAMGAADTPPARNWGELAYGVGRAAGGGVAGVVDRSAAGKIQKRYQVARDEADVERAQKSAAVESQIQGRTDLSNYRVARLGQFKDTFEEKKAFDTWRQSQGNKRMGDYEAWTKWRMDHGDKTVKQRDDYFQWQKQAESDRLSQRKTEFDWRKESKRIDQQIARERTDAVRQNKDDRWAGDRREADVLDTEADDLENEADAETEPEVQAQKLNAARTLRRRAKVISAKIPPSNPNAAAPVKTGDGLPKSKPKSDPLGLGIFK